MTHPLDYLNQAAPQLATALLVTFFAFAACWLITLVVTEAIAASEERRLRRIVRRHWQLRDQGKQCQDTECRSLEHDPNLIDYDAPPAWTWTGSPGTCSTPGCPGIHWHPPAS